MKYSIILSLLLASTICQAQNNVLISGQAPDYAGETITFYKYQNQLNYTESKLAETKVDTAGNFELSFEINTPAYIFTHLGIYFSYLFTEPGANYIILLPEKNEKTIEDRLNPYFEEVYLQIGTKNASNNELNLLIRIFNNSYAAYYNKYVLDQYENKSFDDLEKDIEKMEKPFKNSTNVYFNNYRNYKYGFLKHSTLQTLSKKIVKEYFDEKPVLYENTAYNDFFNQLFNNYFEYLSRTPKGKDIYTHINTNKSLAELKKTLQQEVTIKSDQLLEYIILKNLHDEFYNDKFSRSAMLKILEELIHQTKYENHKAIGAAIKKQVTKLLTGYAPPRFNLYDMDSNLVSLSNYEGKYIYLNFCTANSYACLSEYEMLKILNEKHSDYLQIVTISSDATYSEMKNFVTKRQYTWPFLHFGNQPEVLKAYDVRAFPTYYLIDKEGKLVASPAPAPRENFEGYLFKLLKSRGDI